MSPLQRLILLLFFLVSFSNLSHAQKYIYNVDSFRTYKDSSLTALLHYINPGKMASISGYRITSCNLYYAKRRSDPVEILGLKAGLNDLAKRCIAQSEKGSTFSFVEIKGVNLNVPSASPKKILEKGIIAQIYLPKSKPRPPAPPPNIFKDDRDGMVYNTMEIEDQVWMRENLHYKSANSYINPLNPSKKHGRLYTWSAASEVCPSGWHLPSIEEWEILIKNLKKEKGPTIKTTWSWHHKGNGKNLFRFGILPAGKCDATQFTALLKQAYFWTASEKSSTKATSYLFKDVHKVKALNKDKSLGHSVRCLKD